MLHFKIFVLIASGKIIGGTPPINFVSGNGCGTMKQIQLFHAITAADLPLPECAGITDYSSYLDVYLPYKGECNYKPNCQSVMYLLFGESLDTFMPFLFQTLCMLSLIHI